MIHKNDIDLLNRIKLLMEYDLSLTLSENLTEQTRYSGLDLPLDKERRDQLSRKDNPLVDHPARPKVGTPNDAKFVERKRDIPKLQIPTNQTTQRDATTTTKPTVNNDPIIGPLRPLDRHPAAPKGIPELPKFVEKKPRDISKVEKPDIQTARRDATIVGGQIGSFKAEVINIMEQDDKGYLDPHLVLPIMSFGAYMLGQPWLALALDVIDASVYYMEGDNFMAGLCLAMAIIPGEELIRVTSYLNAKQVVKSTTKKIVYKIGNFTPDEIKLLESIGVHSEDIIKAGEKYYHQWIFKKLLQKLTLKDIIEYTIVWSKRNPGKKDFLKTMIKIGSIYLSYDQLAKIYGILPKTEQDKNLPTEQEIINLYNTSEDQINQQVIDQLFNNTTIEERDKLLLEWLKQMEQ